MRAAQSNLAAPPLGRARPTVRGRWENPTTACASGVQAPGCLPAGAGLMATCLGAWKGKGCARDRSSCRNLTCECQLSWVGGEPPGPSPRLTQGHSQHAPCQAQSTPVWQTRQKKHRAAQPEVSSPLPGPGSDFGEGPQPLREVARTGLAEGQKRPSRRHASRSESYRNLLKTSK